MKIETQIEKNILLTVIKVPLDVQGLQYVDAINKKYEVESKEFEVVELSDKEKLFVRLCMEKFDKWTPQTDKDRESIIDFYKKLQDKE